MRSHDERVPCVLRERQHTGGVFSGKEQTHGNPNPILPDTQVKSTLDGQASLLEEEGGLAH